jgi:thiamine-monophosphate kinase
VSTLSEIGELETIRRLAAGLPSKAKGLVRGVGDDCAVVHAGAGSETDLLLTTDPVTMGVHFASDAPPERIGGKAVGRVISDIAAMAGRPRWVLIDLAAPGDTPVETLERVYRGATEMAAAFGAAIIGGDVSRADTLALHVFGVGEVPCGKAVLRSGARPGDGLFVTGTLGGSLAGRHLAFTPRVNEGEWLRNRASAMIDISDGLGADLRHILEASAVGAVLELDAIPVSDDVPEAAGDVDGIPGRVYHALNDGEDFELLFTVPEERIPEVLAHWPSVFPLCCTRIGTITADAPNIEYVAARGQRAAVRARGYEHFTTDD